MIVCEEISTMGCPKHLLLYFFSFGPEPNDVDETVNLI